MNEAQFWSKVEKLPGPCWLWRWKAGNGVGYGVLNYEGRRVYAHRLSWEWANGRSIPANGVIRHTCDTPSCVRPDHLLLGTQRDNVYDMLRRRRFRGGSRGMSGESNSQAKLTAVDVAAIRAMYLTERFGYRRLSRFFGVSPMNVKMIVEGKRWKRDA